MNSVHLFPKNTDHIVVCNKTSSVCIMTLQGQVASQLKRNEITCFTMSNTDTLSVLFYDSLDSQIIVYKKIKVICYIAFICLCFFEPHVSLPASF